MNIHVTKNNIRDILLYSLSELVMDTLINGEVYDVNDIGLSFTSFVIGDCGDIISYYKNEEVIKLTDKEVLEEIYYE